MLTVILTHHPLVLVSSSGAWRRFWSLCGLVDWTQRQSGRRGRRPPMNWEGSWGWAHWWRVKETEELIRVYQGYRGQHHWVNKRRSQIPVSQLNELRISLFHSAPCLISALSWHCHALFIWFQWSDSAHAGTSVQLRSQWKVCSVAALNEELRWGRVNQTVWRG